MTPRPWTEPSDAAPQALDGVRGFVQQSARAERTLGWILWIALAAVIVVGSF
jgi:hypothetical protein